MDVVLRFSLTEFAKTVSKTLQLTVHKQVILFRQFDARSGASFVYNCSFTFTISSVLRQMVAEEQAAQQEVAQKQLPSCRDHRFPCEETLCLASHRFPEQVSFHLESCVADIGFSKFVALGMTVGSTTGRVSVLIPLELDPGISVGVLTKIFPLRCRGSVPSGGSCWLRKSTCAPPEKRKS